MILNSTAAPVPEGDPVGLLDEFELDIRITTDAVADYAVRGCDTSDGCAATCASACASA